MKTFLLIIICAGSMYAQTQTPVSPATLTENKATPSISTEKKLEIRDLQLLDAQISARMQQLNQELKELDQQRTTTQAQIKGVVRDLAREQKLDPEKVVLDAVKWVFVPLPEQKPDQVKKPE